MSTVSVVSTPQVVQNTLDVYSVSAEPTSAVRVDRTVNPAAIEVDIPVGGAASVRIRGFNVGTTAYRVAVTSRTGTQPVVTWTPSGNDAVSPPFTDDGDYQVHVTSSTSSGAAGPGTIVPIKIKRPTKPGGDLLTTFPAT